MHNYSNEKVVVVHVGLAKVDVDTVNLGVKVTVLIQFETCLEINVKVFKY